VNWLATLGVLLNLSGTLLLVFSLPAYLRANSGRTEMMVPDQGECSFQYTWNVFKGAIDDRNPPVMVALCFLVAGAISQIWAAA